MMTAINQKIRQGVRPVLMMAAEAFGLILHYLFLFAGLWALFLVLGAMMILAATPEALQSARVGILVAQFKPGSILFSCFYLGSASLAFWHWMHVAKNRKGTS